MLKLNPMKDLYESPLAPMALADYEAFSKFLNQALHRCHQTGRDFNVYLDWAIRALASSLAADSAGRIFLPCDDVEDLNKKQVCSAMGHACFLSLGARWTDSVRMGGMAEVYVFRNFRMGAFLSFFPLYP